MCTTFLQADDQVNRIAPTHRQLDLPYSRHLARSHPPNSPLPPNPPNTLPAAPPASTMPCPVRSRAPHPFAIQLPPIVQGRQPTNLAVIANGPPPIIVRSNPYSRARVFGRPASPPLPNCEWHFVVEEGDADTFYPDDLPLPLYPGYASHTLDPPPAPHSGRFANTASLADHLLGVPPAGSQASPLRNALNDDILDYDDDEEDNMPGEPPMIVWEDRPRMPPLDIQTLGNLIRQYVTQICERSANADAAGVPGSGQRRFFMENLIERTDDIMGLAEESDSEDEDYDDESLSEEEMAEKEEYLEHRANALRGFSRSLAILITQISMRQGNTGIVGNTQLVGTPNLVGYPPPNSSSEYGLTRGYPHRGQGEPSVGTQWLQSQEFLYMPDPVVYSANPTPSSPTFLSSGPSPGFRQTLDARVHARRNASTRSVEYRFIVVSPSDLTHVAGDPSSSATSETLPLDDDYETSSDSGSDISADTEDGPSSVTPFPFFRESRPNWRQRVPPSFRRMSRSSPPPGFTLRLPEPRGTRVRVVPISPLSSPPAEEEHSEEDVEDDEGNPPEDRRLRSVPERDNGPLWPVGWQGRGEQVTGDVAGTSSIVPSWLNASNENAQTEGASGSGCQPRE
jgi:hypothetical protein